MIRQTSLKRLFLFVGLMFVAAAFSGSEAFSPQLDQADPADPKELAGTYSVVLFDSGLGNGIQRIAVLDRDGDGFRFEPYAPEFEYRIIRGLSGQDALRRAQSYLAVTPELWKTQISSIRGTSGEVLGYEVRPLYERTAFGTDDVLDVAYRVRGETVFIYMRLIESIERLFRSSGGSHD